jgi:hypothetical protein
MALTAIILAVLLPALGALLRRATPRWWRARRPGPAAPPLSPVCRLHLHLFQGGRLDERRLDEAKAGYRELLAQGDLAAVEADLLPGPDFVVRVRALAELGGDDVADLLERQLLRPLSADPLERSWYLIDLASGLRRLNRPRSLPALLACVPEAGALPLGHLFAAETVCFPRFPSYLRRPRSPAGVSALRALHQALEGLRLGVPARVVADGRLGEAAALAWEQRGRGADPLVARVAAEALRHLRRAEHCERTLPETGPVRDGYRRQTAVLAGFAPALEAYLAQAAGPLRVALRTTDGEDQRDVLLALADLRAEAAAVLLPLLREPRFLHRELAVEVLRWSRDPRVGRRLRELGRRRGEPGLLRAVLRALRHHPSAESEAFLLRAAGGGDAGRRSAAVGSLGWWEPVQTEAVRRCLQSARADRDTAVSRAAQAALARLGERRALAAFREALTAESAAPVHETIRRVAEEGLTWLWPDLDRLADADDADIALHAREALESLRDDLAFAACG